MEKIKKTSVHPQYSTRESRLETYEFWPIEYYLPKKIVAEGGFFHSDNNKDEVTCYSCGVKLYNFEPLDDPYALHAVFSNQCKYNIYVAGEKFIREAIKPKNPQAEYLKCKVCLDHVINILFLPCRHITACDFCSRRLSTCPIHRTPILKEETVYI